MELVITGVDMFTAVGASAEVTYFSVRSGLARFNETGAMNRQRKPRVAAVLPGFRHTRDDRRLIDLGVDSARRALANAGIDGGRRIGTILCLPNPSRPDSAGNLDSWGSAFKEAFQRSRMSIRLRAFAEGSASIALAIRDAAASLDRGEDEATLIGGADSWLPLRALRWLEDNRRLKIGARIDGLISGEAAGFLVMESPRSRATRQRPLAVVKASSVAYEPGHYESDEPCLSVGYTEAVRAALQESGLEPPSVLLSDLNGESYKAKEWAVAEMRALSTSPTTHLHPADCFGDIGSLSGVCQLGLAAIGLARGEWQAPAMVIAGSDGAARAVVIADRIDGSGRTEPDLELPIPATSLRHGAGRLPEALIDDHLEEAGFLRLQRRLAEQRSAEPWATRDAHDRRHAWHLLALAASAPQAETALVDAAADQARPREDRAAALAALALARSSSIDNTLRAMLSAEDAILPALLEAIDDLPEALGESIKRSLRQSRDPRLQELSDFLLASVPLDEDAVLSAIERSSAIEARQRAVSLLVRRDSDGLRSLLASSRLIGTMPAETVAWATAHLALRHAPNLASHLSEAEMTPRVLSALGGAGYPDGVEVLLRYVSDSNEERADAAAAALAALSGIELLEPAGEEAVENEMWSRSSEHWNEALGRVWSRLAAHERIVRGLPWSLQNVHGALAEPRERNGVRRSLAIALGRDGGRFRTAGYYWLQGRASNDSQRK